MARGPRHEITLVAARAHSVGGPGVRVAREQVQPADGEEAHERVEGGGGPRYAATVTRREQRAPQRPQTLQPGGRSGGSRQGRRLERERRDGGALRAGGAR